MAEKNVGKPQFSAVDADRPSGLAADVLKRGESALENCEEMRDANARMLNQNHEIMTAARNGVDLRKDEGKTIVEG